MAGALSFKAVGWELVSDREVGGDWHQWHGGMSASRAGKTLTSGTHNLFSISNDFFCLNFEIQNDALSASKIHEKIWGDRGDQGEQLSFWVRL
jgi:hypothetical protein